jgi:hypothetical protein
MFQTTNAVCRYITEFIVINVNGAPLQLNQALFSEKKIENKITTHILHKIYYVYINNYIWKHYVDSEHNLINHFYLTCPVYILINHIIFQSIGIYFTYKIKP